jgi:hypothetical protein
MCLAWVTNDPVTGEPLCKMLSSCCSEQHNRSR